MGLLVDPADPRRLELAATFLEKGRQVLIELTHPTSGRSGWPIGHHDSLMTGSHLSASFFALKDLKRESAFGLSQLSALAARRTLHPRSVLGACPLEHQSETLWKDKFAPPSHSATPASPRPCYQTARTWVGGVNMTLSETACLIRQADSCQSMLRGS